MPAFGSAVLALLALGSHPLQVASAVRPPPPTAEVLELDHVCIWVSDSAREALLNHPAGMRRLSAARLVVRPFVAKDVVEVLDPVPGVEVEASEDTVVELTFDGGDTVKDLRPHLPLVIRHANQKPPNKALDDIRPALAPRR